MWRWSVQIIYQWNSLEKSQHKNKRKMTGKYKFKDQNLISSSFVDWNSLNDETLRGISNDSFNIQNLFGDTEVHKCTVLGCGSLLCKESLNIIYKIIITFVITSSRQFLKIRRKKNKFKIIPGQNRKVKKIYF